MCANYVPVTAQDRLLQFFGVERPLGEVPPELYPVQVGPFIVRRADKAAIERQVELGLFGLVPAWAKEIAFGRRTYNARSETGATLPSFRDAWRRGQRCIVPVEAIYEPSWETGKAVRWRIGLASGLPFGIAGLWGFWRAPDGREVLSFTMLTVNADEHALMRRFHRAGEEKRMVAILDPADYDAWLEAPVARAREFLKPYPAERLVAEAAPR